MTEPRIPDEAGEIARPRGGVTSGLGVGSGDSTEMASDHPGNQPGTLPATTAGTALAEPIVVANQLWAPADPNAYGGGRPADVTHLRELDLSNAPHVGDAGPPDAGEPPAQRLA